MKYRVYTVFKIEGKKIIWTEYQNTFFKKIFFSQYKYVVQYLVKPAMIYYAGDVVGCSPNTKTWDAKEVRMYFRLH